MSGVSVPALKDRLRPSMEHHLKTWPSYFQEVKLGRKNFEVRRFDRDFQPLDVLVLKEWDPDKVDPNLPGSAPGSYTGREERRRIGYMLSGHDPVLGGLEAMILPGFVVLSLIPTEEQSAAKRLAWEEHHRGVRPDPIEVRGEGRGIRGPTKETTT